MSDSTDGIMKALGDSADEHESKKQRTEKDVSNPEFVAESCADSSMEDYQAESKMPPLPDGTQTTRSITGETDFTLDSMGQRNEAASGDPDEARPGVVPITPASTMPSTRTTSGEQAEIKVPQEDVDRRLDEVERQLSNEVAESKRLEKEAILDMLCGDEPESGELMFYREVSDADRSREGTGLQEWKAVEHEETGMTHYYNMNLVKLVGIDESTLKTVYGSIFAVNPTSTARASKTLRLQRLLHVRKELEENKQSGRTITAIDQESALEFIDELLRKSSFYAPPMIADTSIESIFDDASTDYTFDAIVLPDDTLSLQACIPEENIQGNLVNVDFNTILSAFNGFVACVEVSSKPNNRGGNNITEHAVHAMHLGPPFIMGSMVAGSVPGMQMASPISEHGNSTTTPGSPSTRFGSPPRASTSTSTPSDTSSMTAGGSTPGGPSFMVVQRDTRRLHHPKIKNRTNVPWYAVCVCPTQVEENLKSLKELALTLNLDSNLSPVEAGAGAEARREQVRERASREVLTVAQMATTAEFPPSPPPGPHVDDYSITEEFPHLYCLFTREVTTLSRSVAVWSKLELHRDIGKDVYIITSPYAADTEPLFGQAEYVDDNSVRAVLKLAFGMRDLIDG